MHKTVVFLSGSIGSGKTTYAKKHYEYFTDLDFMGDYATKKDQIKWTLNLLKRNHEVCHITSYPTDEEIKAFKNYNIIFLLMDTSLEQSKTNILIRNRPRDMKNIYNVFKANEEYEERFKKNINMFELVGYKSVEKYRKE